MRRLLLFISLFAFTNVKAYTYVGYNSDGLNSITYFNPAASGTLLNGTTDWWFIDAGQYFSFGNVSGEYINVGADYNIKITPQFVPGGDSRPYVANYIGSLRDTLTQNNLRCGVGDYKSGYDGTYSPTINNFSVTYNTFGSTSKGLDIHIRYNYSQRIQSINKSNQNGSCWFVRSPSSGLYLQYLSNNYSPALVYGITNTLNYNVSKDANTTLLTTITSQNNTIISQNNTEINQNNTIIDQNSTIIDQNNQQIRAQGQTTDAINNTKDTISSNDVEGSKSFIDNFKNDPAFTDTTGLSSIISLPLNFIQSIGSSTCQPFTLSFPHFGDISIPCFSTFYRRFAPFDTIIAIIINGFITYRLILEVFYIVKGFKDPDSDRIEVLDL